MTKWLKLKKKKMMRWCRYLLYLRWFYREKVNREDVGLPSQPLPVVVGKESSSNGIMEEEEEEEVMASIPDFENEEIVREEAEDVLD